MPVGRSLTGDWRVGTLAALIAAVHPVRVDRVANITGSFDLLALALSLWGLAFWMSALSGGRAPFAKRWLGIGFLAAGLLAGEEAVMLVALAGLASWWFSSAEPGGKRVVGRLSGLTALGLLLAAYLVIRTLVLGQVGRTEPVQSGPWPFWSFGLLFWRYLRIVLFPVRLSVAYSEEPLALYEPWVLVGWVGLLICGTAWMLWLRRYRRADFLLIWGFIALVPFSQILPSGTLFAERYAYHAVAPAALAIAWALVRLSDSGRLGRAVELCCFALIVLSISLGTYNRLKVWQGPQTLWPDAVSKQPGAYLARLNYGNWLRDSGRRDEAVEQFEIAVALDPEDPRARVNLGNMLYSKGLVQQAKVHFTAALETDFDSFGARIGLANVSVAEKDYNRALKLIEPVLNSDEDNLAALLVLGYISSIKGEYAQAIQIYQHALKLTRNPDQIRAIGNNISALQRILEGN